MSNFPGKTLCVIGGDAGMLLNFRRELLADFVGLGYEVICLANNYTEKQRDALRSLGVIPLDSPLNAKGMNAVADFVAIFRLIRLFRLMKVDIIFPYSVKPVLFSLIAGAVARVPRMVGLIEGLGNAFTRGVDGYSQKALFVQKIQLFLYKISFPLADEILFLNKDDRRELLAEYGIRVKSESVIGGIGVDLDVFDYSEPNIDDVLSFLFIGRLLREKGIFEFLEAARIVKRQFPCVRFIALGAIDNGNPFSLSEGELAQCVEEGVVEFPGFVDDVKEEIESCSVFVLPSYREGLPRSTQEAMAIGRPVITTDVPGCRDTVVDGLNGFLVEPYSARLLAEKMIFFIENKILIKSYGRASRAIAVERYDVKSINSRIISRVIG